jgi:hypothetical protein
MIMRNRVVLPAPLGPMMPTIPAGGRVKLRSSNSTRSPNALDTFLNSITLSPKRWPLGMKISSLASFSFTVSLCIFS